MTEKLLPARTLERKKREAEALKANMKKRKEQAKLRGDSEPQKSELAGEPHESTE